MLYPLDLQAAFWGEWLPLCIYGALVYIGSGLVIVYSFLMM